jgi:hypothetical protein
VCVPWNADPTADRRGGYDAQQVRFTPRPGQLQHLTGPHVLRVRLADPFTEASRILDQLLGLVEAAVDQRQRGAAGQREVVVAGLAEPLAEIEVLGHGSPERGRALFQQCGGGEQHTVGAPLRIGGAGGQVGDLPRQVDPLGRLTWGPQQIVAGEQTGGQGGRVSARAPPPGRAPTAALPARGAPGWNGSIPWPSWR